MKQTHVKLFLQETKAACKEVFKRLQQPRKETDFDLLFVGEGGDKCISIDFQAEAIFFKHLLENFEVYSEESGRKGNSEYKVILDPIDGSDNFISQIPYYGASIALHYQDEVIAGVIVNFANGDIFYKEYQSVLYRASLLTDYVSKVTRNKHAKVGIFEKSALYTKKIDGLIKNRLKFRSLGAVALSLAYAYDAKYMIFLGSKRTFDLAAGLFLVADLEIYEDEKTIIIAHNRAMLDKLKQIILED